MKINRLFDGVLVPKDIERRIGVFDIDADMAQHAYVEVSQVMRGMVVLEATNSFANKRITYTALHPRFDVVEAGHVIPRYAVIASVEIDKGYGPGLLHKVISIDWQKVTS